MLVLTIEKSKRIKDLPPYLFARIDQIKVEQIAKELSRTLGDNRNVRLGESLKLRGDEA